VKIAIAGPHYWPYWRRGSASYIYNLSKYLAEQGHEVQIITSKPGSSEAKRNGNILVKYYGYIQHPLLFRYNINRIHTFALSCFFHFMKNNYDVVHCIYHPDGFAAHILKKMKNVRYVFHITTTPFRLHWKDSAIDCYMFEKAFESADCCITPSLYAHHWMKREYNIDTIPVPCGVDMDFFHPREPKDLSLPCILFTAPLYDERKSAPILIKAFELLVKNGTKAVLQLAGETTADTTMQLLSGVDRKVRDLIQVLYPITYEQLPKAYASAAVTVLPSTSETFGMTLIESLACGTPVVGTRSGAIPEIISNSSVGSLFDMSEGNNFLESAHSLCQAIRKAIDLARDPDAERRCRQHVSQYSWEIVGKEIEDIYRQVSGKRK
jgi:phosphatidylinositol alpha-mannosyltransferase